MTCTVFRISKRQEAFPVEVRNVNQFELIEPLTASEDLVLGRNWSLYCLDIDNNNALFVELPEHIDLAAEPFYYAAQFKSAIRAAILPLEALPVLASKIKQAEKVVILMSTGRCGSTLASRIFAKIPSVWSVSEPDWFTNLAFARAKLGVIETNILIESCTKLTCRQSRDNVLETIVIKPRSEMLIQAAAYIDTLKEAHAVFLYRDCYGYVNSLYRFAQRVQGVKDPKPSSMHWEFGRQLSTINAPLNMLKDYFKVGETVELCDLMTLGWFLRMNAYLEASADGMKVTAIHYDDLNADKRQQTTRLLDSCGIDLCHLEHALHAFQKDSHAGSAGENNVPAESISSVQQARIKELIIRWGISDYVSDRLSSIK